AYAKENRVPIMESVSMHFLLTVLHMHQPKKILEVGTAIGYSALRMADALPSTWITTLERNETMLEIAGAYIDQSPFKERVEMIQGDALETMEKLQQEEQKYDFIFIDAAKGKYEQFFTIADQLLHPNGIILCDNILFRGFVAETNEPDQKRFKKLAEKLRDFNAQLMQNKAYHTSIIPLGDGLSLSVKR